MYIDNPLHRKAARNRHKYSLFRRAALCQRQHGTHVIIYFLPSTGNWAAFSTVGRPLEATEVVMETLTELTEVGKVEVNIDIDRQEQFYFDSDG
jgi:hypothetical protein